MGTAGGREGANKRARTESGHEAPPETALSASLLQLLLYTAHLDFLTGHWAKGQSRLQSYLLSGMRLSPTLLSPYQSSPFSWLAILARLMVTRICFVDVRRKLSMNVDSCGSWHV